MDEEEAHDHGIGTLRAHIRDWVVTPEPRETPHRAAQRRQRVHTIDAPRTRTPAAGNAFNQERGTTLKVRVCSFDDVLCFDDTKAT